MPSLLDNGGYIGVSGEYDLGGIWNLQSTDNRIVRTGLIQYLDAGNRNSYAGSGTAWSDISGNSNNITLVNSPTFTNNYLTFNGTTQYGNFSAVSAINITSISVFMWVYPVSDGVFLSLLQQQAINSTYHHSSIDILSTGVFRTGLWNGSGVSYSSSSAQSFNGWYYIGFTYTGTTLIGYLNGVSFGSPAGFTWGRPNPLYHGICATDTTVIPGGPSAYGDGRVSTLVLYDRALTQAEITQNFNATRSRFGV